MTQSNETKVLALKYRPKRFDELIGQKSVSQTLSLALDSNKLSHAYLFSGLRGSGKTSSARIFAKALICEEGVSHSPCEICENCRASNIGKHIDIIEMDAASNRKIDDIRDVIEQTRYKPSSARFKIFIIDEVHMLTKEAFNALLKTLEEPPEYVKFILATTDPLKLPATILSRTQHFRFKKIPQGDVINHLKHILNIENIEYDEKALEIIARSGNGSLRDTLTLLEQAIVYSKNVIDIDSVVEMLGILDPKQIEEFFNFVLAGNRAGALKLVEQIEDYDSEMLIDELMSFLKLKLVTADSRFPAFLLDRFFRIVSESKGLLAIGSDSGFVLSLAVLKMLESLKTNVINDEIVKLENELKALPESEKEIKVSQSATSTEEPVQQTPPPVSEPAPQIQTESVRENPSPVVEPVQQNTEPRQPVVNQSVSTPEPAPKKEMQQEPQRVVPTPPMEPTPEVTAENIQPIEQAPSQMEQTPPPVQQMEPPREQAPQMREPESVRSQAPAQTPPPAPEINHEMQNRGEKLFEDLVDKLFDRDFDLGSCFKANIEFGEFDGNTLGWSSSAEGECKDMLRKYWPIIKQIVGDVFGISTQIKMVSKPSEDSTPKDSHRLEDSETNSALQAEKEEESNEDPQEQKPPVAAENTDGQNAGEVGSCVANNSGIVTKEEQRDPREILNDPFVKKAIEVLEPEAIRIRSKV